MSTTTTTSTPPPTLTAARDNKSSSSVSSSNSYSYLLVSSYLAMIALWAASQVIYIPYVIHLLLLVTAILYAACHASLELRHEPNSSKDDGDGDDDDDPQPQQRTVETLKKEDAYSFPIFGSLSLFSLYLAFKYLNRDLVNLLIGVYFAAVGCAALTMTLSPVLGRRQGVGVLLPKALHKQVGWDYQWHHSLPAFVLGDSPLDLGLKFSAVEALSFVVSAAVCVVYFQTKHWALNNILGICFCLQGIARFSLGTYKIGAILLVGLFFYDIFWVFGTDVMVTVAKNLDGPIKILFPRSLTRNEETGKLDLSLLGLGDIIIPGFFLALLLRFDAHIAHVPTNTIDIHAPFSKPYFHSALIAYVAGLATTLVVMIQFNAAQPALLYLVPACLGSSLLCATLRGELKELFDYSEEEDEEEEEEEGDDDDKDAAAAAAEAKKDN